MGERRLRGRGNLLVLNGEEYRRPLLLNFPRPPTGRGWHLEGPGVRRASTTRREASNSTKKRGWLLAADTVHTSKIARAVFIPVTYSFTDHGQQKVLLSPRLLPPVYPL